MNGPASASDQKQTCAVHQPMSALCQKRTFCRAVVTIKRGLERSKLLPDGNQVFAGLALAPRVPFAPKGFVT